MLPSMNRCARALLLFSVLACSATPITIAQDAADPVDPADRGTSTDPSAADIGLGVDASLSLDPARAAFGTAGTSHWGVTGGVGFALEKDDDSTDPNLALTYHHFLVDDFEVIGELGAWYFAQDGGDAAGINPGFTMRWHFVNRDRWSLYADAGIGLLLATDDVPRGGSSFGFMPRAGAGASVRLNDDGLRGYLGVRWHHISNARITGDDRNPDRDGVMVYGGVMLPW
jgi:opacity protein-like surface antigen